MTPELTDSMKLKSASDAATALGTKVLGWGEELVLMLPNLFIAVLVMGIALGVARLASAGVRRAFGRVNQDEELVRLIALLVRVGVTLAGVFLALSVLELEKTVTSLLAGLGVLGIALGFAFQDIAANFMSGVLIVSRRPFDRGDWVVLAGVEGTVHAVDLRSVTLLKFSGESVQIPNKDVFQSAIVNHNRPGFQRVEIDVGVAYGTDLEAARTVALEVLGRHNLVADKRIDALVMAFGESAIELSLRFWITAQDEEGILRRRSAAIVDIERAFDDAGVGIPFPIVQVQVAQ